MTKSAKGTAEAPGKKVAQKAGLNRGIANAGFSEVRRQIEYKALWARWRGPVRRPVRSNEPFLLMLRGIPD